MFFIMGISSGRKELTRGQQMRCAACGNYTGCTVFMTYTILTLFFIPVLKWGRKYYVQTNCCGTLYLLDPEVGRRIARGEELQIRPEDLTYAGTAGHQDEKMYGQNTYGRNTYGSNAYGQNAHSQNTYGPNNVNYGQPYQGIKVCPNCGFRTAESYKFCPECGRPL